MQHNVIPANKSDEPTETVQIVCTQCHAGITCRATTDASGKPHTTYRCPNCGPRPRTGLDRIGGSC